MHQGLASRSLEADAASLSNRLEAFRNKLPTAGPTPIDRESAQPQWPGDSPLPEVALEDFDANKLRSAMATSGSLIVRGFLDRTTTESYKTVVDQILAACENRKKNGSDADASKTLFNNPPKAFSSLLPEAKLARSRGFHRLSGSAM